ncbi:MAG: 16S rRNA (uracil(1498)-N(3))-methyltransferase [Candidatus Anammoxibacter sp.]
MNLILLFENDFIDDTKRVRLKGRRLKHIVNVHKALVGDKLCVGLEGENIGTGTVTCLGDNGIEMDVVLDQPPPDAVAATLILAMLRPRVLKRMLSQVCAMGIKRIILINSYRVEKSFWKSPVLNPSNLKEYLTLGLEQGRDTIFPEVLVRPLFKPFVEDELPDIVKGTTPFVAHPLATEQCPYNVGKPVTLAVGPEGGFTSYEVGKLEECGFSSVHLGKRILHVETAVPFLLSRLT